LELVNRNSMNRYVVWKTYNEGDFVKADRFVNDYPFVQFILDAPVGSTNPSRVVAQYNINKIIGFSE